MKLLITLLLLSPAFLYAQKSYDWGAFMQGINAAPYVGFFYNMADKPIRTNNWAVYTINDKIGKDAAALVLGGNYQRKGIFYFDQFRQITIYNNDFEADTLRQW